MADERDANGRFAKGNPGGPGRPRRAVERDYIARLGNAVTPDAWQKVVERALADAQGGDAKARDWLTRHLIGDAAPRLIDVAAAEERGATSADEVSALAEKQASDAIWAAKTQSILDELANR